MTKTIRLAAALALVLALSGRAWSEDSGQQIFERTCGICHSTEPGQNKLGPSLAGVVGRKAGALPNFAYSAAMKNAGITWSDQTLDQYIANPKAVVPGNKMLFVGLKNADERHAVIVYLESLKS
jgi:cytochrome c